MLERCLLTTKDFTILEVMLDRRLRSDAALVPLIRRKLDNAVVVFRDDIPADVVTLNSRVRYRIGAREPETRIVSHDELRGLVGFTLPITHPRGLALLGLGIGGSITIPTAGGGTETLHVEKVLFQPEGAGRALDSSRRAGRKLRLVYDADALPSAMVTADPGDGPCPDDPGPAAA
ncbi:nucleoside-diphosphate kinase [Mesorhizobium sp. L-8-10]|uniref:nucleoside-diphosphate kinase n=1 Tax=unclassified Mesorhizobium TaxID=325217 RepID=UPI00193666CF|nr:MULTISPECIES: nucleoside-diphosphate kinase [unclassified Mesorhizobium]BCH23601.1 nucleoside-diphosphate kinase [Mesorhizobium sp. L-8-3]BCH31329.1 nucleoside-diphosphate kinase [Mesorhizobium sp. L-8-10]